MPKFFITVVWNFNKDSNVKRIEEFESFKKRAEVKGTITNWVIEYQPTSGHAHAHCTYDTSYTNTDTIRYAFKKKGLHVDVVPVKKGTDKYLEGYIHKSATKEPHSTEAVVERTSVDHPEDNDEGPMFNATPEWKQQQILLITKNIRPVPLWLGGDMFNFF